MIVLGTSIIVVLLVALVVMHCKTRRILNRLASMLDLAKKGEFVESIYDESKLSAVECQMKQWIAQTITTSNQLEQERNTIKTTISDISHQTKTPISNISIYTELLLEQELTKEGREYCKRLQEQSQKLSFLISALVKASRLETKVIKLQPVEYRISDVIDSVCAQISQKAKSKQIEIIHSIEDRFLLIDPKWSKEAVYNILDNAVKYAFDGTQVSIVGTAYQMFYRVDITNKGIGVEPNEINHIFERFYRSKRVSEFEGVGLGLYLAREIITLQGGYIKVTQEKETTFSIFFRC